MSSASPVVDVEAEIAVQVVRNLWDRDEVGRSPTQVRFDSMFFDPGALQGPEGRGTMPEDATGSQRLVMG